MLSNTRSFYNFSNFQINGKSFDRFIGEGTQIQLRNNKIKFNSIEDILISHLHRDVLDLQLVQLLIYREKHNIYGPRGIKNIIISLLKIGNTWTNYKLEFTELDNPSSEIIYDKNDISITTIPLLNIMVFHKWILF